MWSQSSKFLCFDHQFSESFRDNCVKKCYKVLFFSFFLWWIHLGEFFLFQIVERSAENRFLGCILVSELETSKKKSCSESSKFLYFGSIICESLRDKCVKKCLKVVFYSFFLWITLLWDFFLFHIVARWAKNVVFVCISTSELESSQKKRCSESSKFLYFESLITEVLIDNWV